MVGVILVFIDSRENSKNRQFNLKSEDNVIRGNRWVKDNRAWKDILLWWIGTFRKVEIVGSSE